MIRKLYIPETWELVDKEGILFDDRIEDILAEKKPEKHLGMFFSTAWGDLNLSPSWLSFSPSQAEIPMVMKW